MWKPSLRLFGVSWSELEIFDSPHRFGRYASVRGGGPIRRIFARGRCVSVLVHVNVNVPERIIPVPNCYSFTFTRTFPN